MNGRVEILQLGRGGRRTEERRPDRSGQIFDMIVCLLGDDRKTLLFPRLVGSARLRWEL